MKNIVIYLSASVLLINLNLTYADVIVPEVANAQKRFADNPTLFDQTDQYCTDKKIGASCQISGNVFEGGDAGTCQRSLVNLKIALQCQRTEKVIIDRKLPNVFSLRPPFPKVFDQFCAKLKAGETCKVNLIHNGKPEQYTGICKQHRESSGYRLRPQVREVLSCEAKNPTPARVYKPVSTLKKLFKY